MFSIFFLPAVLFSSGKGSDLFCDEKRGPAKSTTCGWVAVGWGDIFLEQRSNKTVFKKEMLIHLGSSWKAICRGKTRVIKHSWLENPPFSIGNTSSKGSFSIAMLVYQRIKPRKKWFKQNQLIVNIGSGRYCHFFSHPMIPIHCFHLGPEKK